MIKIATHARFDEGMNDLPSLPPNAAYLKRAQHGAMPPEVDEISFLDLDVVDCPFAALRTEHVAVTCDHPTFGLELGECEIWLRAYIESIAVHSTVLRIRNSRRRYVGAFLVSVNDINVFTAAEALSALEQIRHEPVNQLKLIFAPKSYVPAADRTKALGITP
jgi:hypothetical protein